MKVLITGATGFIGKGVMEELDVGVVDRHAVTRQVAPGIR